MLVPYLVPYLVHLINEPLDAAVSAAHTVSFPRQEQGKGGEMMEGAPRLPAQATSQLFSESQGLPTFIEIWVKGFPGMGNSQCKGHGSRWNKTGPQGVLMVQSQVLSWSKVPSC